MIHIRMWRGFARLLPVLSLLAALAGCAELTHPAGATPAPRPLRALDFYAWLKSVPAADIERERGRLGVTPGAVIPTVSAALLWSVPLTAPSDDPRALGLLDNLEGAGQDGGDQDLRDYRILGTLWREVLAERERFRAEAEQDRQELERQRDTVRVLKQQNADLRRQIDGLKSIERQINRRG